MKDEISDQMRQWEHSGFAAGGCIARPETIFGINAWITDAQPPGDFLRAVLCNDLKESFARADSHNRYNLFAIVYYLCNHVPTNCYGSVDVVNEWPETLRKRRELTNG